MMAMMVIMSAVYQTMLLLKKTKSTPLATMVISITIILIASSLHVYL